MPCSIASEGSPTTGFQTNVITVVLDPRRVDRRSKDRHRWYVPESLIKNNTLFLLIENLQLLLVQSNNEILLDHLKLYINLLKKVKT